MSSAGTLARRPRSTRVDALSPPPSHRQTFGVHKLQVLMHGAFFILGVTHYGLPRDSRVSPRECMGWQTAVTAISVSANEVMNYKYGPAWNSSLSIYNVLAFLVADKLRAS